MHDSATVVYAGFWRRLGASFIDCILQAMVLGPIIHYTIGFDNLFMFDFSNGANFAINDNQGSGYASWTLNLISGAVIVLFWKYKSATPGKMLMGIKLVDAQTFDTPPTGRLILRFFAYYVSALAFCLGFLWVAFDSKKRGFHDMIAKTLVIKVPAGTE